MDWPDISGGEPGTWLYFYEGFLEHYDNELRKQTGSYYTPPQVVEAMVRMVDELLRSPDHFGLQLGLGAPTVTLVDPALGTGTFLLAVLSRPPPTVARVPLAMLLRPPPTVEVKPLAVWFCPPPMVAYQPLAVL